LLVYGYEYFSFCSFCSHEKSQTCHIGLLL
jgi:hypothetical protein